MSCKNILIVEDEAAISSMMKDILELKGYNVFTASDGAEGIEHLKKLLPEPCVIILDLMMPKTNGWEFLDVQRSDPRLADIPVVICSAYTESAKAVKPHGFVPKPVQLKSLVNAVQAFCA